MMKTALIVTFLLLPVVTTPATDLITLNIWTIDDTIIHGNESTPEERIAREAQYTLSGMIYGWDFSYTPGQAQRDIPETFTLSPIARVTRGAEGFTVRELRRVENTIWGQIRYSLSELERAQRSSWETVAAPRSSGVGHGELLLGWRGKEAALEDALRMALREHLRRRHPNRPLDAEGSIYLVAPPRIRTLAGRYEARVTVAIQLREVRDFLVW